MPYGDVTGNIEMAHLSAPLWYKFFLNADNRQLRVAGAWIPPKGSPELIDEVDMTIHPGEFGAHVNAWNFPLAVLETFVPGISGTNGAMNANVKLFGPFNKIGMNGKARIVSGQLEDEMDIHSWVIDDIDINHPFINDNAGLWQQCLHNKGDHFSVLADMADSVSLN